MLGAQPRLIRCRPCGLNDRRTTARWKSPVIPGNRSVPPRSRPDCVPQSAPPAPRLHAVWRVCRCNCRQGYPALGVRRKGHRTTLIDLPTGGRAQLHERQLRRACVVVDSRLDGCYPLARQDRLPIGVRKKGPGQSWDHPKETTWKAGCDAARSAREPS